MIRNLVGKLCRLAFEWILLLDVEPRWQEMWGRGQESPCSVMLRGELYYFVILKIILENDSCYTTKLSTTYIKSL